MSPVAETLVTALTKSLSGSLVNAAGRRLRHRLQDPERSQALERSCQAGVVAILAASRTEEVEERRLLEDVFREFFGGEETGEDVGREVAALLRGHRLDRREIEELFAAAGFDAETLPGLDLDRALDAFEGAFVTAAAREAALQGEIQVAALLGQLALLREMRDELKKLVEFLADARLGTVEVGADRVEALSFGRGMPISLPLPSAPVLPPSPLAPYLDRLMAQAGQLTLSGVDPAVAVGDADAALRLDAVYTALATQGGDDRRPERVPAAEREPRAVPALERLNRHRRLVLLGDPGSGKTTFVNFVALSMAGELRGSARAGLAQLTAPLPDDEGKDQKEPQIWDHGPLLPLRVVLRDFAARGLPPPGEACAASHLWDFVAGELERAALGELAAPLKDELSNRGGLVLFDGLDEVPEAEGRRGQILQAVGDFAATFGRCRYLVTCRTYAYQKQRWRLPGFEVAALAPWGDGQIRRFVERWYDHVAVLRQLAPEDARGRAAQLTGAIFGSDRLRSLASRPLLLTLMASLHAWREGSLPERREELYDDAVKLLLDFWERKRVVLDAAGEPVLRQPSLAEWLRVDREAVRRLLNELAFQAHAEQPELVGTADVAEEKLVAGLLKIAEDPDARPARLVEHLRDRAGLLLPRGAGVYTFPHRTFQEYLAACHLTDDEFPDRVARLARSDAERWREVALLAGAKAARGTPAAVWHLAHALCFRGPGAAERGPEDVRGAHLAGLLLAESAAAERVSDSHREGFERVRAWQLDLLAGDDLAARDRAECGRSLARLRDPRREVLEVAAMELCRVPAGLFRLGSEKGDKAGLSFERPAADLDLPYDYWVGRYPVTNAQFAVFTAAGGYGEERFWPEAKAAGLWRDGALTIDEETIGGPRGLVPPYGLPNHPVVGVSWYEAWAFCRWLTALLRREGQLAEGWAVHLPSEAEWEKAARGGLRRPASPQVSPVGEIRGDEAAAELIDNEKPRRRYPWGDEIDRDLANYDQAAIGSTSAVGAFPRGASPHGCEEMSGNVWEWTRSLWGRSGNPEFRYPYEAADGREDLDREKECLRVVRGGAFYAGHGNVRCASRYRDFPSERWVHVGFRVALSPFSLSSDASEL